MISEFHPFTIKEIKKIIRSLQKGIREDKKLIKFYEINEKEYPHLKEAKKVRIQLIERYAKEIKEWKEEIKKLKEIKK